MTDLVEQLRASLVDDFTLYVDGILERCESPIEKALMLALLQRGQWLSRVYLTESSGWPGSTEAAGVRPGFRYVFGAAEEVLVVDVAPQVTVAIGDERYRIDVALSYRRGTSRPPIFVAIECDGHEFHERTKEQAERDKARDRSMQVLGWHVARFTGSEIWRDPHGVALKVRGFVAELWDRRGAP